MLVFRRPLLALGFGVKSRSLESSWDPSSLSILVTLRRFLRTGVPARFVFLLAGVLDLGFEVVVGLSS